MTYKKGESGNPAGRPKGISRTIGIKKCREIMDDKAELIINQIIEMALAGSEKMLAFCGDRILPAYRSIDAPVDIEEIIGKRTLYRKALAILDGAVEGKISPKDAKELLSSISDVFRIKESTELERDVRAIKKKLKESEDSEE